MKIVGLEEHFVVPEVLHAWQSLDPRWRDLAVKPSSEGEAVSVLQVKIGASSSCRARIAAIRFASFTQPARESSP
jgi:hypothetical protein